MYYFRWSKTKYGPLNEELQLRYKHPCEIICRGFNGSLLIRFKDGYEAVVMKYAVGSVNQRQS